MVTITNYLERQRKDGSSFVVLEVSGGLELIQSRTTGNFYATVRKCNIPCTFTAEVAKNLVGSQIPGQVVRVQVDSYDYINIRTGEVMQLQHSYAYRPEGSMELLGESKVNQLETA